MKHTLTLALIMTALSSLPASASEAVGKQLHDTHCQQCHDNTIYTRKNSIIHGFSELQARVEFCESANNKNWSEKQINEVVKYLNNTFYKFPAK
jgi:hypothetical protein